MTVPPDEQTDDQTELGGDQTDTATEELSLAPITQQACVGDVGCPASYNNCFFQGDLDCGEEFCRTPGAQCDAQPSTFIRVEHVYVCFNAQGNSCVSFAQGRRLVHCGC